MNNCEHKNTKIWEPHLAGAKKCCDCGLVYNPNRKYQGLTPWFDEDLQNQVEEYRHYLILRKKFCKIVEGKNPRCSHCLGTGVDERWEG